jgi:hypothetical protein
MNTQQVTTTDDGEITGLPPGYERGTQSLAVSLALAEIDQQITTAHAYPRSIDLSMKNILTLATLDEETAAECVYALPRAGKPIKGPSIRLAEIIQSQYGNNRVGTRVVHVDRIEKYVEAEGIFHDLETNTATTARVRRRISDKRGRLLTDDMIIVTGNAAASIAKRNAILAGVPKAVWRRAYLAVESVLAGDVKTLVERRTAAMKAFAAFGITPEQVCAVLEIQGVDDITLEHLTTLIGMHSALKNGESTVEEMFGEGAGKPAQPRPTPPPDEIDPQVPLDDHASAVDEPDVVDENVSGNTSSPTGRPVPAGEEGGSAAEPPLGQPLAAADLKSKLTKAEAIERLLKAASDKSVPSEKERLENLDILLPIYQDALDDEAFRDTLFQTAIKVAKGRLQVDSARKYLEGLG